MHSLYAKRTRQDRRFSAECKEHMQQLPESKMHLFFNSKLTAYKVEKEEIDHLLACEGLVKHIVLYHNRRFTNLGYCVVVSSLSALPQLRRLLGETH